MELQKSLSVCVSVALHASDFLPSTMSFVLLYCQYDLITFFCPALCLFFLAGFVLTGDWCHHDAFLWWFWLIQEPWIYRSTFPRDYDIIVSWRSQASVLSLTIGCITIFINVWYKWTVSILIFSTVFCHPSATHIHIFITHIHTHTYIFIIITHTHTHLHHNDTHTHIHLHHNLLQRINSYDTSTVITI